MFEPGGKNSFNSDPFYLYGEVLGVRQRLASFFQKQLARFVDGEEGRLFLWLPICLALGIGAYFSSRYEPSITFVAAVFLFCLFCAFLIRYFFNVLTIPVIIVAVVSGFILAKVRTEIVRGPVISKVKGVYAIEGRLDRLTLLPGTEKRLLLSKLVIKGISSDKTPLRIRLTSRIKEKRLIVGARIRLRAILRPPPGPVRPGGFDFARQAWFSRLGAVGFAISKADILQEASSKFSSFGNERLRQIVTDKIRSVTTGPAGAIALALIVGEKRSIDKNVLGSIRAAGLAHMLAISGMHMALVSGTMFWVLRALFALSSTLALLFDVRKLAAVGAILVAGGYYLLSGMGISTLRAFIMITIMLVAVLLGRKALSLRNVSIAALIILVFFPESLLSVGFQMSFASVVALISFYESGIFFRQRGRSAISFIRLLDKFRYGFMSIFATTLIAGFAVGPIAVYHFHHITTYSVVGNVLAMPVLSLVVMPMALVGLITMPFDLHAYPLFFMTQGNTLIVAIADYVAGFDDARVNVGTIGMTALMWIVFGGLWLCLWTSAYRYVGLFFILVGLGISPLRSTPFLLIERDGKNIALIDADNTMWPMRPRAGRYSLTKWRSAYGAEVPLVRTRYDKKRARVKSHSSPKWRCDQYGCTALFQGLTIAYSSHPGALEDDCAQSNILITTYPIPASHKACHQVKIRIDIKALKRKGSHAIYLKDQKLNVINSREVRGKRPWTYHN